MPDDKTQANADAYNAGLFLGDGSANVTSPPDNALDKAFTPLKPVKLPVVMPAVRVRSNTPFGHLHLTVVVDLKTEREVELFAQLGRAGAMVSAETEGLCRLASLYLRSGGALKDIVRQLKGIGSVLNSTVGKDGDDATSVPDSLARALEKYTAARDKHGLRALVLGEFEQDEPAPKLIVDSQPVTG
jgi:ribonucleoside-diphosphate reductase alpha chain